MSKYLFQPNEWDTNAFDYVYTPNCDEFSTFEQEQTCIKNKKGNYIFGYEYISILEKNLHKSGAIISTRCAFESFGAPLLVFTNDVTVDENGRYRYGEHYEVVAYEKGCNVWHIIPAPKNEPDKKIVPTKLAHLEFAIQNNQITDITVEIVGKIIKIDINGNKLKLEIPNFPEQFRAGITACEGINRFYEFAIVE